MDFSARDIISKRVPGSNVDFLTMKITSKIILGNNEDFLDIEITSKKIRESNVGFSDIMEIWYSTYRRRIDVESTWIRLRVPVGWAVYVF